MQIPRQSCSERTTGREQRAAIVLPAGNGSGEQGRSAGNARRRTQESVAAEGYSSPRYALRTMSLRSRAFASSVSTILPVWMT